MEVLVGRSEDGIETRVFVEGVLDGLTISEVRPSLEALVTQRSSRVVVDLSRLRLIDSCGVGALVGIYKMARANDCSFELSGACQQPLAVLKLLKLDQALTAGSHAAPPQRPANPDRMGAHLNLVTVAS